jgi:predicted RNA-binding Zn ribbon-like protein
MGSDRKSDAQTRRATKRQQRIPSFSNLPVHLGTQGLKAGLAFMEGRVAEWTIQDLVDWFSDYLNEAGVMRRPNVIREPGVAPVTLDPRSEEYEGLRRLIERARARVTQTLQGFIASVTDDRFLNAAIYCGRVRRTTVAGKPAWTASPREIDFLGDVVLSLFAADILADRDFYRTHLCFCDACGCLAIKEDPAARSLCQDHRPRVSGLISNVRSESIRNGRMR